MSKNDRHVVPDGDGWAVKKPGQTSPESRHKTQQAAIDQARRGARRDQSELIIHRPNGQIRDRDSYGNDDFPPKG